MQNLEVIIYRQRMLQQTIPNFANLCVYHFTTKVGTLDMIRTCIKRSKSVIDYCLICYKLREQGQEKKSKNKSIFIEVTLVVTAKIFCGPYENRTHLIERRDKPTSTHAAPWTVKYREIENRMRLPQISFRIELNTLKL